MKNIFLLLSVLLIVGCETKPSRTKVEVRNYILDGTSWRKDLNISGFSAFVEVPDCVSNERDCPLTTKALFVTLKSKTEEKLKTTGFKTVPKSAEAHLWVLFDYSVSEFAQAFSDKNIDTTNGKVIGKSSLSEGFSIKGRSLDYQISSDEGLIADIQMIVYAQDYGHRAEKLSSKQIRIPVNSPKFAESVEKVADEWIQDLAQASGFVKEKAQKGLPGCMPRFGFEGETILIENVPYKQVTSVQNKSPAAKAGLKIGDIVLAIDSIPYMDFSSDPGKSQKVYESKKAVEIKFLRKTQEIQSNIKAQIMCD